jgi:hypothetical protein
MASRRKSPAPEDWWAPPRGDGQFDDPLVEAVVMALVGRGHDERRVRGFVRSYVSPDGRRTGADGVRAWFLGPVLDAIADRLAAAPAGRAAGPVPDDDVMAIADAVQGRRGSRAGRDSRPGRPAAPPDDVMAIADVLQRRRTGQGGA